MFEPPQFYSKSLSFNNFNRREAEKKKTISEIFSHTVPTNEQTAQRLLGVCVAC